MSLALRDTLPAFGRFLRTPTLSRTVVALLTLAIVLMLAINIDPTEVARLYPAQFRDMQVNCSLCESKERCRKDLGDQTADREHVHYCSNVDHLKSLQQSAPLLMA